MSFLYRTLYGKYTPEEMESGKTMHGILGGLSGAGLSGAAGYGIGTLIGKFLNKRGKKENTNNGGENAKTTK